MIQDIYPSLFDNHFKNAAPLENDKFLFFSEKGELFCNYDSDKKTLFFPLYKDLLDFVKAENSVFLFSIDNQNYFLLTNDFLPFQKFADFAFYDMKALRRLLLCSNKEIFAAFSAFHLWKWYSQNRFCGVCGKPTVHDNVERALVCSCCGQKIYPRINPAVIIGIINGDKLLITKYKTGYAHNALVAGFTEFGETLEQTVEREVMEEVGLKVKNIRYYKSQPWGVALDLLAGFFCEVDGNDKIKMDTNELKYAQWVNRSEIELQPSDYSLTNEMMKMFRDGKIK